MQQGIYNKTEHAYDADTWFPDLDADPQWKMTKISEEQTYFDLEYYFTSMKDILRAMRILNITAQKPDSTGSGIYLSELVRELEKEGHTQAVIAGVYPGR